MAHGRQHWYTITQRPLPTGAVKRVYVISCSKCGRQAEQHAGMQTDDMRRKGFQRQGWDIGKWKNLHVCPECNGRASPNVEADDELPEPAPQPKGWMEDLPRLQQAWALSYEDEHLAFIAWLRDTYGDRYIPAPAPPPPTPSLQELLEASDDEQRIQFWRWLRANYTYSAISGLTKRYKTSLLLDLPVPSAEPPPARTEIDEFLRQVKEGTGTNVPPPVDDGWQHGSHIDSMPVEAPPPPIENPPTVEQVETPAEPVMPEGEAEDWYVNLMADIEKKKTRRK